MDISQLQTNKKARTVLEQCRAYVDWFTKNKGTEPERISIYMEDWNELARFARQRAATSGQVWDGRLYYDGIPVEKAG